MVGALLWISAMRTLGVYRGIDRGLYRVPKGFLRGIQVNLLTSCNWNSEPNHQPPKCSEMALIGLYQ